MKIYAIQKKRYKKTKTLIGLKLTSIFIGNGLLGWNARLQLLDLLLQPDTQIHKRKVSLKQAMNNISTPAHKSA